MIDKIYELVGKSVNKPNEVKRCLEEYVEKDILDNMQEKERPKRSCRKYYPTRQDLCNHISKAISAQKYCKDDQAIEKQFPDVDVYVRLCNNQG